MPDRMSDIGRLAGVIHDDPDQANISLLNQPACSFDSPAVPPVAQTERSRIRETGYSRSLSEQTPDFGQLL